MHQVATVAHWQPTFAATLWPDSPGFSFSDVNLQSLNFVGVMTVRFSGTGEQFSA